MATGVNLPTTKVQIKTASQKKSFEVRRSMIFCAKRLETK